MQQSSLVELADGLKFVPKVAKLPPLILAIIITSVKNFRKVSAENGASERANSAFGLVRPSDTNEQSCKRATLTPHKSIPFARY